MSPDKHNKLRCTSCGAEFYTALSMSRIMDAPCPNCKEKTLEEINDQIDAINDTLIPPHSDPD